MKNKVIEIITTGEELLSGVTQDSNFFFLAMEVFKLGFKVNYQQCVGDNLDDIVNALSIASKRSDYVLVTGGLGPTDDDLTRDGASIFFNKKLKLNINEEKKIKKLFKKRKRKYSDLNKKQAMFPIDSKIISNENGTAPGFMIIHDKSKFYFYPGVPREFRQMVNQTFLSELDKSRKTLKKVSFSKMIKIFGLSESEVAERIKDFGTSYDYIGYRPYNYEIHLRLISVGKSITIAKKRNKNLLNKINKEIGGYVYSESKFSLVEIVVMKLIEKKLTISISESCTGGLLANMITNVPNASKCFHYGFVTYGNTAKEKILGVKSKTLKDDGAVSKKTVTEMLLRTKKISGSDISIAISGIAGPTGGTKDKPVGTVYIGIAFNNKTIVKKYFLPATRELFKLRTCLTTLDKLRRMI